jgi:hypothetical protein
METASSLGRLKWKLSRSRLEYHGISTKGSTELVDVSLNINTLSVRVIKDDLNVRKPL